MNPFLVYEHLSASSLLDFFHLYPHITNNLLDRKIEQNKGSILYNFLETIENDKESIKEYFKTSNWI